MSKGTLPAKRAGQRKLLVRRSDLDRMLAAIRLECSHRLGIREPRTVQTLGFATGRPPLQSIRQLSTADIHGYRVDSERDAGDRRASFSAPRSSGTARRTASENPPPDPGFPDRVRALAYACERQAESLGEAASVEGFGWTPLAGPPPHEPLPRAASRRPIGPAPHTSGRSSIAPSSDLGIAMEGGSCTASPLQYRDLAAVMHEIADLLLGETPDTRGQQRMTAGELVRKPVRNSRHCAGWVADHAATAVRPATTGDQWSPGALCGS